MRTLRPLLSCFTGAVAIVALASPATAFASSTAVPNVLDAAQPAQDVRVTVTGVNSNIVFVQQCWRSGDDPAFDLTRDCSQFNAINPVVVNGAGEGVISVFNGDDPNLGEWSCGTKGSAGVPNAATCFLRVTPESIDDVNADEFLPITWSVDPPPPPSTSPPSTVPGFTTTVAGGVSTTASGSGGSAGGTTTTAGSGGGVSGSGSTVPGVDPGASQPGGTQGGSTEPGQSVPSSGATTTIEVVTPAAPGDGSDTPWVAIIGLVIVGAGIAGYIGVRSSRRRPPN